MDILYKIIFFFKLLLKMKLYINVKKKITKNKKKMYSYNLQLVRTKGLLNSLDNITR